MARARVLHIGQCVPDHAAIRAVIEPGFDAEIDRVMHVDEACAALRERNYDLVLVKRLIFADGDGLELIPRMRDDETLAHVPVMMISNFADAQERAVESGAVPGFGKPQLGSPKTSARIGEYLPGRA